METGLDPINSPVKDETAMNVLRLESRVAAVVDYLARLKAATRASTHHSGQKKHFRTTSSL